MQRISSAQSWPLHSVAATRLIEQARAARLPPHTLMQRAGLAVARLALALAPHARHIWIACGPGNNGGDGFEAALHLHRWGKAVTVSWTGLHGGDKAQPADAAASRQRAIDAGVPIQAGPPADFDLCIDALLGIGGTLDAARPGSALMREWLAAMDQSGTTRLCVDVPTGLNADTGHDAAAERRRGPGKRVSLSLLTLKPGLFTASGRDSAGEVWFDDLDTRTDDAAAPDAWLLGQDCAGPPGRASADHASHKGSFGDVAVIGGESTAISHMAGAALLAARAALHEGAGRVLVALLDQPQLTVDTVQPELMFRSLQALDMAQEVVVCGCGGGDAVRAVLPRVLSTATRLVLDADALNAIAGDTALQTLLAARAGRRWHTVITPHPLEAARLGGTTSAAVQADRIAAAQALADRFGCVVVLKGSGTVVATPGQPPHINSSGNALLATAGTGDVLAGMVGAGLAQGLSAWDAACSAVFRHGQIADQWLAQRPAQTLTASDLAAPQAWTSTEQHQPDL